MHDKFFKLKVLFKYKIILIQRLDKDDQINVQ
jgi:hypothetical protein